MARSWRDDEEIVRKVANRDYANGGAKAALYSDEDYGQSLYNSKLWQTSDEAGRSALHDANEKIASKYGFSTGADGSEYIKLDKPSYQNIMSDAMQRMANYGQFTDPYQAGIEAKYNAIVNRDPFSYDYATDPRWQAYKKEYVREGRRATEDTLGQYAAMTGGMPSTAAVTAASQAGDYYNAKLTDKIPELYQLAYDMYAADAARDLSDLNALRGLSGDAYSRWNDAYGRLGDIYNLAYGERGYSDTRADNERSYADARSDKARADAIEMAKLGAQYKDYSGLRALGINPAVATGGSGGSGSGKGGDAVLPPAGTKIDLSTDVGKKIAAIPGSIGDYLSRWDDIDAETRYMGLVTSGVDSTEALRISNGGDRWQAQQALSAISGSSDGGDVYQQLFNAGISTEDEAKRFLQSNGMKYTEANDAAKTYMGLYGNGTFGNTTGGAMMNAISDIKSEKDAVNMLEENGIMVKPLTREQWALDSGNSIFKTYSDYLKAFVYEYMNGG